MKDTSQLVDMYQGILDGAGWTTDDYILNSKHSPLSNKEKVILILQLSKAGKLADASKLTGKEKKIQEVPQYAFMNPKDVMAKHGKGNTNESINEEKSLESGVKLTHKHNKDISIELVGTTNRGWKVKQTEPKGRSTKTTTQYYDSQDLSGDKAIFESITENGATYPHSHENKISTQIFKKVGGNEMKFYDELELLHDKIGHPKFMKWIAGALRCYNVNMYKHSKIKNAAEAEEALYLLTKKS